MTRIALPKHMGNDPEIVFAMKEYFTDVHFKYETVDEIIYAIYDNRVIDWRWCEILFKYENCIPYVSEVTEMKNQ